MAGTSGGKQVSAPPSTSLSLYQASWFVLCSFFFIKHNINTFSEVKEQVPQIVKVYSMDSTTSGLSNKAPLDQDSHAYIWPEEERDEPLGLSIKYGHWIN